MVLLRALGASSLLLLASCWTPVFNQDVSVAELIRSKLHLDSQFEPSFNNGNGSYFLQAVESHDGSVAELLTSTYNTVTEQNLTMNNSNQSQLDRPLPDTSMVVAQPQGSFVGWFIPTLLNSSGGTGNLGISNTASSSISGLATGTNVIGYSATEDSTQTLSAWVLTATGTALNLYVYSTDTLGSLPSSSLQIASYTGNTSPGWMAVNTAGTNGVTIYLTHAPDSSGKYTTDVVDATGLIRQWSGKDHVVAFLSTNRLLTREGSFYNVCDTTGNVLYSFPGGTLQFAGEYYDSSSSTPAMRSRFSEALVMYAQNGGQDKVRVRFYSIATAKLDSLQ